MTIGGFNPILPSAAQDVKAHERTVDANERAAQAQGISGDDKESEATSGDRDADGRQAWQRNPRQARQEEAEEHKVADLSGKTGSTLDLSG